LSPIDSGNSGRTESRWRLNVKRNRYPTLSVALGTRSRPGARQEPKGMIGGYRLGTKGRDSRRKLLYN
jgi:hypothetical protein